MAKTKKDERSKSAKAKREPARGSKRGKSARGSSPSAALPRSAGARSTRGKAAVKKPRFTAATADKYELYQLSVQSPEEDVSFFRRVYKSLRGKSPKHLREDFCGTAFLASQWVTLGADYTAEGFDIDPEPMAWGMEHNFEPLGSAAARCSLHLKDVREPSHQPPDVRCALNFSYCILQPRQTMVEYFRAARADLAHDGVFILDIHGGPEAMDEVEEERKIDEGFTYIWDQEAYWPATGEYVCHIHFEFKDGTRLDKAFTYDWRLWSITEIVDCLREAGFASVESYWEGTADDGESGDGIFRKKRRGENCLSWIAYIVAAK